MWLRVRTYLENSLNLTLVLENFIDSFLLDLCDAQKKIEWNSLILGRARYAVLRFSLSNSPDIYQYHYENLRVLEIKRDLFPFCCFRRAESNSCPKQSKIDWMSIILSPWKLKKVLELSWNIIIFLYESWTCLRPQERRPGQVSNQGPLGL